MFYSIDGLVIKVNKIKDQITLGNNIREPNWAIAWKFSAELVKTVVLDIIVQTGSKGKLTPVAILKPVYIDGVLISKACLHNLNSVYLKDIRIGDTVLVKRAGDVIPQIESVVKELRPLDSKVFEYKPTLT